MTPDAKMRAVLVACAVVVAVVGGYLLYEVGHPSTGSGSLPPTLNNTTERTGGTNNTTAVVIYHNTTIVIYHNTTIYENYTTTVYVGNNTSSSCGGWHDRHGPRGRCLGNETWTEGCGRW